MLLLPELAVVFVGITGDTLTSIQRQLVTVLRAAHVEQRALPPAMTGARLAHARGREPRDRARTSHADGVIGGELVDQQRQAACGS